MFAGVMHTAHVLVVGGGHFFATRTGCLGLRGSGVLLRGCGSCGLSPGHHGQGEDQGDELVFHRKNLRMVRNP